MLPLYVLPITFSVNYCGRPVARVFSEHLAIEQSAGRSGCMLSPRERCQINTCNLNQHSNSMIKVKATNSKSHCPKSLPQTDRHRKRGVK